MLIHSWQNVLMCFPYCYSASSVTKKPASWVHWFGSIMYCSLQPVVGLPLTSVCLHSVFWGNNVMRQNDTLRLPVGLFLSNPFTLFFQGFHVQSVFYNQTLLKINYLFYPIDLQYTSQTLILWAVTVYLYFFSNLGHNTLHTVVEIWETPASIQHRPPETFQTTYIFTSKASLLLHGL